MPGRAYMLNPGEDLRNEGSGVKASADATGGAITLIDSSATGGAPLHIHQYEDECFFVVEGEISVRCDGERWLAPEGSFVFLPRGCPHAWDVEGDRARVLIITVPGGFEQFLRAFHDADDNESRNVAEEYGIEFLPDPEW